jgi:hypothetical protein
LLHLFVGEDGGTGLADQFQRANHIQSELRLVPLKVSLSAAFQYFLRGKVLGSIGRPADATG